MEPKQLRDALAEMRASASDPQRVYSCLVRVYDHLAAQPPQAEAPVNSVTSQAETVALLQELLRAYLLQEEIAWYLCRVLALACAHSVRFQCQAGQLELWNDVFELRSAHPASMRVLESSLELYEALLRRNELHVIRARPAQSLIDEMLAMIDRFSSHDYGSSGSFRPEMVVGAVRVLVAVYSSPRIQALVEERNETFATAIVSRLVATSAIFLDSERDVRLWLRACRLQLQQHLVLAVSGVFLEPDARSPPIRQRWFRLVLDKWSANAAVMLDFVALLSLVFAVPHALGADLVAALASELLQKRGLLAAMCELLASFGQSGARGGREPVDPTAATTALEIVRVLRQWSAVDATLTAFAATSQVSTLLVPALVAQLMAVAEQLRQHAVTSAARAVPRHQTLQLALEVAITLQQLHSHIGASLRRSLPSATLRQMRKDLGGEGVETLKRDSDGDALVRRELAKLEALLSRSAAAASGAKPPLKTLASSSQSSRPPSLLQRVPSSRQSSTLALRAKR